MKMDTEYGSEVDQILEEKEDTHILTLQIFGKKVSVKPFQIGRFLQANPCRA
jgi:hypothetical protein